MDFKRNIFLIGPMGSGKSAVGRHLARMFHLTFHDSDADIEAKTGVDISFIFEKEGEAGFRLREKEAIDALDAARGDRLGHRRRCRDRSRQPHGPSPTAAWWFISRPPSINNSNVPGMRGIDPC